MTNGEKIKEIFPNIEYEVKDNTVLTNIDNGIWFSLDWWNAEYKEPCEDWYDIPSEEMTLEQARQAVKDLRKKLAEHLEQEPRKGHWIFCEGIKGKDNVEKCSCCGSHWKEAIIYRTDTQEYLRTRLLYCPNCGAEMEGGRRMQGLIYIVIDSREDDGVCNGYHIDSVWTSKRKAQKRCDELNADLEKEPEWGVGLYQVEQKWVQK